MKSEDLYAIVTIRTRGDNLIHHRCECWQEVDHFHTTIKKFPEVTELETNWIRRSDDLLESSERWYRRTAADPVIAGVQLAGGVL